MENQLPRLGYRGRSAFEPVFMVKRYGFSVVELLVVFTIVSILLALLFPAVQSARERARETVCKNNLRQIHLALSRFRGIHKQLPNPAPQGRTGGWMVEILPYIEQQNVKDNIMDGIPIANVSALSFRPPAVFRCPRRTVLDQTSEDAMFPGHYVIVREENGSVYDAPVSFSVPWINGPEMRRDVLIGSIGPHSNGFFYSDNSRQGLGFMLNGQSIH
ncbi:DUF1559 family PulG-like putative transporter [Crateriforma spongiae]|uniref:DUF1559 family PulG-like putative transporter n=1 Tax=Crateriforma spongiae TaxID=2724528 RepID=UPI00197D2944|nr:DUF1559 domain-containing protein [Crateriforma spongiae]